ncbi:MAG: branched-chain amino acid ABC transporter permease/ATP-binding protein [Acidimicrobiia bacterium]|nr:branched-chain amino acid ABC transporter permease/ATP-binding protein [Acidimicrobiia bacterium]
MDVVKFALIGLGLGALYSLASQGLIVIYRGSGVLSFAHGAIGMVGAYLHWEIKVKHEQPAVLAWIVALAACALIGALSHLGVMRQLRRASPLARVVATLGIYIVLLSAAALRYGQRVTQVSSELPQNPIDIAGATVSVDRFILAGIAAISTVALWALYRYTTFGLATTAVAENQRAASTVGLSPDRIATLNWALGSALAAMAAILIAPIVQLQVQTMTGLVLAAMAGALIARFHSFPVALAAGLLLGVIETEIVRFAGGVPGLSKSLGALVIVGWLIYRGQALPLRDFFLQRLPAVGLGRVRPGVVVAALLITGLVISIVSPIWQDAFVTTFSVGIVLLSLVVLTGYAGQLSLAQFALAGFGSLVAGRLVDAAGWPFLPAMLAGVAATVPLGALFALPAVRARGINLAIATLALGTAIELMIFQNGSLVGGFAGTKIGRPSVFGWSFDAIRTPNRYAMVCMGFFALMAWMVSNIRRGRSGRRLLAVRTNERAAAALGISVPGVKVYAFALSAGIAAVGGVLYSFRQDVIIYGNIFPNFNSILAVAYAFIGGIGYLFGPISGSTLAPGSIGANISNELFSGISRWVPTLGGAIVVALVLQNQDGLTREQLNILPLLAKRGKTLVLALIGGLIAFLALKSALDVSGGQAWLLWLACMPLVGFLAAKFLTRILEPPLDRAVAALAPLARLTRPTAGDELSLAEVTDVRDRVDSRTLVVEGLTVRYGGVTAVEDLDFVVRPGTIVGLIGPNGAGKTSAIDAITGFTAASGRVLLDGVDLASLSVPKRTRSGISRSFQSLELFEDSTVLDNIRAASDPRDRLSYVRDLVYPKTPPLPSQVVAAIREFRLEDVLDRQVQDLPYGQRRLLAIARAVATQPSVLLLDEPAAGLGDVETAELAHLVRRLADDWGMAVLLVEHDMNFVMSVCDEIVVLDFGRKIADGPREQVRNDPAVIAAYLGDSEDEHVGEVVPG